MLRSKCLCVSEAFKKWSGWVRSIQVHTQRLMHYVQTQKNPYFNSSFLWLGGLVLFDDQFVGDANQAGSAFAEGAHGLGRDKRRVPAVEPLQALAPVQVLQAEIRHHLATRQVQAAQVAEGGRRVRRQLRHPGVSNLVARAQGQNIQALQVLHDVSENFTTVWSIVVDTGNYDSVNHEPANKWTSKIIKQNAAKETQIVIIGNFMQSQK